ncbi:mitochondrial import inner membrane translocase subunit TIM17 [Ceratobasidium sp. AG-Ba]|nr:mitochondrial import inner membrane translocase subunit TIM17 [Ceratobasidium sp. AG-Ba]QRW04990.1 mitochondrial import inner membrane translocase subunit TIM17 [Ceratobasidium sp. AG-Ba]
MANTESHQPDNKQGKRDPEPGAYEPKSSLQNAAFVGLQSAGVGVLVSAVQNALDSHNRGAAGIFTRTGGTIGFFSAMGASFAFTEAAVANARETDDSLNGAAGGCAAGMLAGLRARSIPMAFASCAAIGTLVASFDAAGRSITGGAQDTAPTDVRAERRRRFFKKPPPLEAVTE